MIDCTQCNKETGKSGCSKIPKLRRFVLQNFPFIEKDFDALTDYELLCKVVEYLNQVIQSQNCVVDKMNEVVELFEQLRDFVNHYFDNLDVQEEINNKLDDMAEDGTLQAIIINYLNITPLQDVQFKNISNLKYSVNDLYNGYEHAYLQGFCYANGNLVIAFRNNSNEDDIIRLVEYDYVNGRVLKEQYLELAHANSISYRKDTNKLYVAACTKVTPEHTTTPDNRIFVVDYDTFLIDKTINISNIPVNHRIRSVWYDNDDGILYAGDVTDMYVIDEETETFTEHIELETKYIDTSATNQTLKKVGQFYYGIWISFISVWSMDKKLVRVIPIDPIQAHLPLGECEDIAFDDEGNIILGSIYRLSPRSEYYCSAFLRSNLTKNAYNLTTTEVYGSATTPIEVFVDDSADDTIEDGTQSYPFKDIQTAVNYATRSIRPCTIRIASGTYEYTYINACSNLSIAIDGDVTIDGLEIQKSQVTVWNNNSSTLTLNGISSLSSYVSFQMAGENKLVINRNVKTGTNGHGKCVWVRFGQVHIQNAVINGNNTADLTQFDQNAIISLRTCIFNDYTGFYAIHGTNNAVIFAYFSTFNVASSSTQHNVLLQTGSRFFHRNGERDINDFVVESQSMIYPSIVKMTANNVYYGEVATIDTHYNALMLQVKFGGGNDIVKNVIIDIEDLYSNNIYPTIDLTWVTPYTTKTAVLNVHVDNNDKLKITRNRLCVRQNETGVGTYTDVTTNENPSADWACITKVGYCNL